MSIWIFINYDTQTVFMLPFCFILSICIFVRLPGFYFIFFWCHLRWIWHRFMWLFIWQILSNNNQLFLIWFNKKLFFMNISQYLFPFWFSKMNSSTHWIDKKHCVFCQLLFFFSAEILRHPKNLVGIYFHILYPIIAEMTQKSLRFVQFFLCY